MAAVPRLGVTEPISTAAPTALDLALSEELERELRAAGLFESNEEAVQREEARGCAVLRVAHADALALCSQVLGKLDTLVKDWVRRVSAAKGFTEPLLSEVRPSRALRQAFPLSTLTHCDTPLGAALAFTRSTRASSPLAPTAWACTARGLTLTRFAWGRATARARRTFSRLTPRAPLSTACWRCVPPAAPRARAHALTRRARRRRPA